MASGSTLFFFWAKEGIAIEKMASVRSRSLKDGELFMECSGS
jgi:hypothetical protein